MPDKVKERVAQRLINIPDMEDIISFMNQEPHYDKLDLGFLSVTEKLDEIRSENFSECFSEFYRILVDGGINEEPWVVREYFRPVSQ